MGKYQRRQWFDEQIVVAVKANDGYAAVLRALGFSQSGGNHQSLKDRIERLNLDTSHFRGRGWSSGQVFGPSPMVRLEDALVVNSTYSRHRLKKRLISSGLLINKCSECGIVEWNGKSLSLHLDHINGVNNDNRMENLRLLCPNCHSQTPTYCGKNIAKSAKPEPKTCIDCGSPVSVSDRCRNCAFKRMDLKIQWPKSSWIIERLNSGASLSQLSEEIGASRTAIRQHIKNHPFDGHCPKC